MGGGYSTNRNNTISTSEKLSTLIESTKGNIYRYDLNTIIEIADIISKDIIDDPIVEIDTLIVLLNSITDRNLEVVSNGLRGLNALSKKIDSGNKNYDELLSIVAMDLLPTLISIITDNAADHTGIKTSLSIIRHLAERNFITIKTFNDVLKTLISKANDTDLEIKNEAASAIFCILAKHIDNICHFFKTEEILPFLIAKIEDPQETYEIKTASFSYLGKLQEKGIIPEDKKEELAILLNKVKIFTTELSGITEFSLDYSSVTAHLQLQPSNDSILSSAANIHKSTINHPTGKVSNLPKDIASSINEAVGRISPTQFLASLHR